jgi:hypothetical protein
MKPGDPKQTQATISAFASTHCATCAYGWTRRGTDKAGREVLSI